MLRVGLRCEVVEERRHVGHDLCLRDVWEILFPEDLQLLRIRKQRLCVHRFVGTRAVEEIRQEDEVALLRETLADLQHRGANADAIHEHDHRRPGPFSARSIYVARTDSVVRRDLDLAHVPPRTTPEPVLRAQARSCRPAGQATASKELARVEPWSAEIREAVSDRGGAVRSRGERRSRRAPSNTGDDPELHYFVSVITSALTGAALARARDRVWS